jgi:hypothetical protein
MKRENWAVQQTEERQALIIEENNALQKVGCSRGEVFEQVQALVMGCLRLPG